MSHFNTVYRKIAVAATIALSVTLQTRHALADSVAAINITGLPPSQELTVYYANGRPAGVGVGGSTPIIHSVYLGPVKKSISASGTASVSAQSPTHVGFAVTNYVVLIVTNPAQSTVYFRNPDQSVPTFPGVGSPGSGDEQDFENEGIKFINLVDTTPGSDGSIDVDFSTL